MKRFENLYILRHAGKEIGREKYARKAPIGFIEFRDNVIKWMFYMVCKEMYKV